VKGYDCDYVVIGSGFGGAVSILGGAVMAQSREQGVIDTNHEVFGHPGLYVADASAISANLGVNPSLTITAMAERFASLIAPADGAYPTSAPARAQATPGPTAPAARRGRH
jgi:cholesterol oxidase